MKVKVFDESHESDLEDDINKFLLLIYIIDLRLHWCPFNIFIGVSLYSFHTLISFSNEHETILLFGIEITLTITFLFA